MSYILVKQLNDSQLIVLYTAGAGAQALCHFTLHPGSSKYAMESSSFYAKGSLELLLNRNIEKFVTEQVAEDMALKALIRSHEILRQEYITDKYDFCSIRFNTTLGIGVTAAIRSVNERQGRHHAFICLNFGIAKYTYYLDLVKGVRTREEEDQFISDILFKLIIKHSSQHQQQIKEQEEEVLDKIQILENAKSMNLNLIKSLQNQTGLLNSILITANQYQLNPIVQDAIILSGSFNPIHFGHIELAKMSQQLMGLPNVYFELSIKNADKQDITIQDVEKRIELMKKQNLNIILSNKAFFKDKNLFLKNGAFAIGVDTYKRVVDVKYYNNSIQERDLSLLLFLQNNNKIIVAPRYNETTQKLETLNDYEIPKILEKNVIELKEFRNDISSTKIRQSEGN
ncbi:unnamed protein product (macronuclear) [Paramecium tetraurelia]|uniref:Cytidyltransferase-like domain-containing protein n=1 Tax=Paramecium tetraurelia TaxID=5888 RepID=A0DUP9_PARTE|nr:uncharacterized protein GSPATT00020438001 [Paramecium tetraurelia]CAK86766.1 unnamed protein product [Paramecium tetraurelia]|eukprot:XP_001454163.1 hypothetical protein (macronuclear) [Paramecium tetraurelia strain d4-2]